MFEWDERKAAGNLRKHRVAFDEATEAFEDRLSISWIDDSEDYGEERLVLLGMTRRGILNVVYTLRGETIRIISARLADRYEQDNYFRRETS